jgi:hypothetical protein
MKNVSDTALSHSYCTSFCDWSSFQMEFYQIQFFSCLRYDDRSALNINSRWLPTTVIIIIICLPSFQFYSSANFPHVIRHCRSLEWNRITQYCDQLRIGQLRYNFLFITTSRLSVQLDFFPPQRKSSRTVKMLLTSMQCQKCIEIYSLSCKRLCGIGIALCLRFTV